MIRYYMKTFRPGVDETVDIAFTAATEVTLEEPVLPQLAVIAPQASPPSPHSMSKERPAETDAKPVRITPEDDDATVTGYTPSGLRPLTNGYRDTKWRGDRYRINVLASPITPPERVEAIARKRAAAITLENNFPYFRILEIQRTIQCSDDDLSPRVELTRVRRKTDMTIKMVSDPGPDTFVAAEVSADMDQRLLPVEQSVSERLQLQQFTRAECNRCTPQEIESVTDCEVAVF